MSKRKRWVVGLALVVLAVTAACSAGRSDSSSSGDSARPAAGAAAPTDANETSFAVENAGVAPSQAGRDVVSTATVRLRSDDIAQAKMRAATMVEAAGGLVFAEQGQYGEDPSVTMTLKVPPDRFRSVLAQLAEVGAVDQQDIATEDVTEQVIDLESRIASAETSVARVRGFLDRATNVLEISSLEAELLRRETDLERLRGQQRALDARVDLATIVLTVRPSPVGAVADPSDRPGFLDGLATGWAVLVGVGSALLVVLGALVPFLPVVAVAAVLIWWTRRRGRAAVSAS
jgi:hypothetical protein